MEFKKKTLKTGKAHTIWKKAELIIFVHYNKKSNIVLELDSE